MLRARTAKNAPAGIAPERIALPHPRRDGSIPVESCIRQRRSVRDFRDQPLTESLVGQLLWAAQGATGPDARRAAPSAGALYPLELHVACGNVMSLTPGVYRYVVARHELVRTAAGDVRGQLAGATGGQEWIATAAAVICIAAVFERTTAKYGSRGRVYVCLEAGHAAENLMLEAVALDLATTMVGAFSDREVQRILRLDRGEIPLGLIPVGAPASLVEGDGGSANRSI